MRTSVQFMPSLKSYSDVIIGHAAVIKFLSKSIALKRLHHAYLFNGPTHVGKGAVANWFIKNLLCLKDRRPDCPCTSCQVIESAAPHLDLVKIYRNDPAARLGVDQVRIFQDALRRRPSLSHRIVGLIESANDLSESAMNALLKILEEPPANAIIILISNQSDQILPTVISRCQVISFQRVPLNKLTDGLRSIGLSQADALTSARLSNGLPELAIKWQADKEAREKYLESARNLLKLGQYRVADRLQALHGATPLKTDTDQTPEQLLYQWLLVMREILLYKIGCKDLGAFRLTSMPIKSVAERCSLGELAQFIRRLWRGIELSRRNVNSTFIYNYLAFNYEF